MEKKKNQSQDNRTNGEINNSPAEETETTRDAGTEPAADTGAAKEANPLQKELEEQKDKYLRLLAEYENYRKRTQKEKCDSYSDAFSSAVTAFLPLIDSLERALEFSPEDEGIKALAKQSEDILKILGITAIESDGRCFDPNFHNAIMHEQDESTEECRVVQTFQKGYLLGDRVIRHAMVKVVN